MRVRAFIKRLKEEILKKNSWGKNELLLLIGQLAEEMLED